MLYTTSHSLLLSAACTLIISRIIIATDFVCKIPPAFTVEISDYEKAYITDAKLNVYVEKRAATAYAYPGTNSIDVRVNPVLLTFMGDLNIGNGNSSAANEIESIFEKFMDRVSGIAHRTPPNSISSTTNDCRVVLLPTEANSPKLHLKVVTEIHRLAESCVEREICSHIDRIRFENAEKLSISAEMGLPFVYTYHRDPPGIESTIPENGNYPNLKEIINSLVDAGLAELTEDIQKKHQETISLPEFEIDFSTGSGIFKTTGEFKVGPGKFRDLSTIRRRSDVVLTRDGMTFTASGAFGPDIAAFSHDNYKLRYGIIKVYGSMTGNIDSLTVEGKVSVDYNQTPCVSTLDYLKIKEMGQLKIYLTGLGPFNWILSMVATRIAGQSRADIARSIEDNIRKVAQSQLSSFPCEQYRP